jgi:hypothetical protein
MRYPTSTCAVALATALLAMPAIAQVVDFGKYPDFRGQWDNYVSCFLLTFSDAR